MGRVNQVGRLNRKRNRIKIAFLSSRHSNEEENMTILVNGSGLEGIGMNNTKYAQYGGMEQVEAKKNGLPDPDSKIHFVPSVASIAPRKSSWNAQSNKLKAATGDVVSHGSWGGKYQQVERK